MMMYMTIDLNYAEYKLINGVDMGKKISYKRYKTYKSYLFW